MFLINPYVFGGAQPPDPHWASVYLMLHGDGTAGSQVFVDSSTTAHTTSGVGTPTIQATPAKFSSSISMPGGSSSLFFYSAVDTGFDLNQTAWTWEMWVYETPSALGGLVSKRGIGGPRGWALFTSFFSAVINGIWNDLQMSWTRPAYSTWNHFALVKDGTELRVFINGARVATKTGVSSIGNETATGMVFGVGDYVTQGNPLTGNLDDIRYTRGVARYNADFAVPTLAFPNY
jgi:hypothetical protein